MSTKGMAAGALTLALVLGLAPQPLAQLLRGGAAVCKMGCAASDRCCCERRTRATSGPRSSSSSRIGPLPAGCPLDCPVAALQGKEFPAAPVPGRRGRPCLLSAERIPAKALSRRSQLDASAPFRPRAPPPAVVHD